MVWTVVVVTDGAVVAGVDPPVEYDTGGCVEVDVVVVTTPEAPGGGVRATGAGVPRNWLITWSAWGC